MSEFTCEGSVCDSCGFGNVCSYVHMRKTCLVSAIVEAKTVVDAEFIRVMQRLQATGASDIHIRHLIQQMTGIHELSLHQVPEWYRG